MKKKKKVLSMAELTANVEKALKGKELNPNGKKFLERTLKEATKPRGSK